MPAPYEGFFSLVFCIVYGHSGVGFGQGNSSRFRRIGSLLAALQLPWIAIGDWNIQPSSMARTGFLERIGGHILCADIEYTCTPANSEHRPSHLDYVICSEAAKPYIRGLGAVVDVPWKPHVGLSLKLIAQGSQLYTRYLDLPARLPIVPRPQKSPVEGSKSSVAKIESRAKKQLARERRHEKIVNGFQ